MHSCRVAFFCMLLAWTTCSSHAYNGTSEKSKNICLKIWGREKVQNLPFLFCFLPLLLFFSSDCLGIGFFFWIHLKIKFLLLILGAKISIMIVSCCNWDIFLPVLCSIPFSVAQAHMTDPYSHGINMHSHVHRNALAFISTSWRHISSHQTFIRLHYDNTICYTKTFT